MMQSLFQSDALLVQIAVVLLGTLVVAAVKRFVMKSLIARAQRSANRLDDTALLALNRPLIVLIWILGLFFALSVLSGAYESKLFDVLAPARSLAIIAIACWFLLRLVKNVERSYVRQKHSQELPIDLATVDISSKVARILILIISVLAGLQVIGVSVAGLLAVGGIGGVAVGFAAKELISNFFGGLMIYLERPFSVGETISSPDMDIEGTVEEISWGQTALRRFDSRLIYVPNSVFNTISVLNRARQTNRRIYEYVGIRYDDLNALEAIVDDTRTMLLNHPEIDHNNSIMVNFDRFAASSLDFFIYCFTVTTVWAEYHAVKQDVLFKTARIIESHGAEIAFPTSTLHVPDGIRTSELTEIKPEPPALSKPKLKSRPPHTETERQALGRENEPE